MWAVGGTAAAALLEKNGFLSTLIPSAHRMLAGQKKELEIHVVSQWKGGRFYYSSVLLFQFKVYY